MRISRRNKVALGVLSGLLFTDFDTLGAELQEDAAGQDLRHQIAVGTAPERWQLVNGLLLYNSRVFVPESSSLWPQLLCDAHEAGHEGAQKSIICGLRSTTALHIAWSAASSGNVPFVRRRNVSSRRVSSSSCLCFLQSGVTSPWISWRAFHGSAGSQSS